MKPHKHCELIKAWADGAKIQSRTKSHPFWRDAPNPSWDEYKEYRIKPREFKEGAYYPAITNGGFNVIVSYHGYERVYRFRNSSKEAPEWMQENNFLWIGEELPETLWSK